MRAPGNTVTCGRDPWAALSVHSKTWRLYCCWFVAMLAIFTADLRFGIQEPVLFGYGVAVALKLSVIS